MTERSAVSDEDFLRMVNARLQRLRGCESVSVSWNAVGELQFQGEGITQTHPALEAAPHIIGELRKEYTFPSESRLSGAWRRPG
jgi:hypothetical protein